MTGALTRASIGALAAAAAALALLPGAAAAAVADPGISYDLDGAAPVPPSLGQLDLYVPDAAAAADRRPVVVYVHGGGWRAGDKGNKIARKASLFTGAGYLFASVNYRLSPNPIDPAFPADRVRFPAQPDDVGEAIAWIDRNVSGYGGDPARILLIGHSAGAHLVSLVSTDRRYVTRWGVDRHHLIGTVSLDTDAYDVAARVATGTNQARALIYNAFATPAENAADGSWAAASPLAHAGAKDPSMLLVTQAGAPRRAADSAAMAAALGAGGGEVLAVPYDHAGINDAVGSPDDPAGETTAIIAFFERMVAAADPARVRIERRPRRRVGIGHGQRRARVRFRFAARTAAAGFECRRDSGTFRRCSSPVSYRVGKGRHRFRVRAIASNGEHGPVKVVRFRAVRR